VSALVPFYYISLSTSFLPVLTDDAVHAREGPLPTEVCGRRVVVEPSRLEATSGQVC